MSVHDSLAVVSKGKAYFAETIESEADLMVTYRKWQIRIFILRLIRHSMKTFTKKELDEIDTNQSDMSLETDCWER